jgi:hypothetical protein
LLANLLDNIDLQYLSTILINMTYNDCYDTCMDTPLTGQSNLYR